MKSRPTTSRPGTKPPSTTNKGTNPRHVPCVKNTPFGYASGITTKAMRSCQSHGQRDCKTHWKSLFGLMGGSPKNPKITWDNPSRCRGMGAGKAWNHSHCKTPSSYDKRAQAWIFALCIHTFSFGALVRKGNRHATRSTDQSPRFVPRPNHPGTVRPDSRQSDCSAWLSKAYARGKVSLISHMFPAHIHKNQRTPGAPGSEPHLRQRQRDAALAAWERANTIHDANAEAWQRTLDLDHFQVYQHAAARLEKILKDPQHYLHEKPVRRAGHTTKQHKKRLIQQRRQPWVEWEPHRSGFQCHTCHVRVHQGLTVEIIEQRLQQPCDLLQHEAPEPGLPTTRAVGKKTTRAGTIAALPAVQTATSCGS